MGLSGDPFLTEHRVATLTRAGLLALVVMTGLLGRVLSPVGEPRGGLPAETLMDRTWWDQAFVWAPKRYPVHAYVFRRAWMGWGVRGSFAKNLYRAELEWFRFHVVGQRLKFEFPETGESGDCRVWIERYVSGEYDGLRLLLEGDPRSKSGEYFSGGGIGLGTNSVLDDVKLGLGWGELSPSHVLTRRVRQVAPSQARLLPTLARARSLSTVVLP